jgi:hypothetical protein
MSWSKIPKGLNMNRKSKSAFPNSEGVELEYHCFIQV